jgi:cytochrome c-type biogenesis protein CcmH/NrfG
MDILDTIQLKARRLRRRLRHAKRSVSDRYLLAQRPIEFAVLGVVLAVAVALVAYLAVWPHA